MGRLLPRLLGTYLVVACIVLIAPMVVVVIVSFSGDAYLSFPPRSFSLQWFAVFFGEASWQHALWQSIFIASVAAIVATAAGFLAAYAFLRSEWPGKKLLLSLMLAPAIVPHIITAIALYFLSARMGLVGSTFWIGLCHSVISMPVVLLILLSSLQGIDLSVERAALGLGCNRLQLFRYVVVPIVWPGVLSAGLFAFLTSFDELLISLFLGGGDVHTLPVRIWQSLEMEVEPTIAAVSTFLIALTSAVLLADWLLRTRRGSITTQR